jgi:hypothetical protein
VVVAAAASSWLANAVMLFCSSMVKVVRVVLVYSALMAVITSITPIDPKGKRILPQVD